MDGRGLAGWHKPSFNPADADTLMSHNMAQLGDSGNIHYVSLAGSDSAPNDGSSWGMAFRTIIHAVSVAQPGDTILVGTGIFDETANGPAGVVIAKPFLRIISADNNTIVTNTDTTDGGSVLTFSLPATISECRGLNFQKGETTSNNSIIIKFDGVTFCNVFDGSVFAEKSSFIGVQFNAANTCVFGRSDQNQRTILGSPAMAIGVDFNNAINCLVTEAIIANAGIGAQYTGSLVNGITDTCDISACVIGAQLNAGVIGNILSSKFTNCGTNIIDNSGNATNERRGSFTHLHDDVAYIPKHPGSIFFVDSTNGLDTNSGHTPTEAFQTITAAITVASAGDAISILAGTYNEAVNLNKAALQLWPELGVVLTNTTPGVPLTISANNCVIRPGGLIVSQAGQVGIHVTGQACRMEEIIVTAATIGIDIDAAATIILRANISGHTTTAVDVSTPSCILEDVQVIGAGGATRGFYLSASGADNNILNRCISSENGTAGFELISGTVGNVIKDSASGEGDGSPVDSGLNSWPNFKWIDRTEEHEDLWPVHLGQGVSADPVTIDNTATDDTPDSRDDQDYWGDTVAIIAPNAIIDRWISNGINIFASVANKIMRFEVYYPQTAFSTARNGGNAWDLGETVLTVADGTIPQAGDKVWLVSTSHPNGEIQLVQSVVGNVVTVASETRASGNTGIRYNHAGGETMYVIERNGLNRLDGHQDSYAAANTKASARHMWSVPKDLPPNAGMIGRLLNQDDDLAASIQVNVIYGD